jgi:hypothetical protein
MIAVKEGGASSQTQRARLRLRAIVQDVRACSGLIAPDQGR